MMVCFKPHTAVLTSHNANQSSLEWHRATQTNPSAAAHKNFGVGEGLNTHMHGEVRKCRGRPRVTEACAAFIHIWTSCLRLVECGCWKDGALHGCLTRLWQQHWQWKRRRGDEGRGRSEGDRDVGSVCTGDGGKNQERDGVCCENREEKSVSEGAGLCVCVYK